MDLSLISNPVDDERSNSNTSTSSQSQQQQQPPVPVAAPQQVTRSDSQPRLSIHNLMNNEEPLNNNNTSVSPKGSPLSAPIVNESKINQIRSRNSIMSLTNDEDVGMDGKAVPSISRRLSHTSIPSSNNSAFSSPVLNVHNVTPAQQQQINNLLAHDQKTVEEEQEEESESKNFVEPKPPVAVRKSSISLHDQIKSLEVKSQANHNDKNKPVPAPVSEPGKPTRYFEPPIWAQDYEPQSGASSQRPQQHSNSHYNGSSELVSSLASPSITGTAPRNDINKTVTEWIWANIEGIKYDYQDIPNVTDYIELELKLGNIWEKGKDRRLQLPVNTESVLSIDYFHTECYFKSGIPLQQFHDVKVYLSQLVDITNSKNPGAKQFFTSNSHTTDLITSDMKRNDKPSINRVSLDMKTKRVTESIKKQRIADLFVFQPNSLYDMRLSMALELPMELNDTALENFKKKVSFEREKERVSYVHQTTFTKVDVTKVRELQTANNGNNSNGQAKRSEPKYELELELNTTELLKSIARVSDDPLYYVDLVQAFLDNGRVISRFISSPS